MTGSIFSQDLSLKKIVYDNELGVFLNITAIDTLTYKLIDRKGLIGENTILKSINDNYSKQITNYNDEIGIWKSNSKKWETMYNLETKLTSKQESIISTQKNDISFISKKNNKNKLMYFLGGVIVGGIVIIAQ